MALFNRLWTSISTGIGDPLVSRYINGKRRTYAPPGPNDKLSLMSRFTIADSSVPGMLIYKRM